MGKLTMRELVNLAGVDGLPSLEKTFYKDLREYMESLKKSLMAATESGDPERIEKVEKKIRKAREYYETIFRRRMSALFSQAIKKVTTEKGIGLSDFTPEEVEIFHEIMDIVYSRKEEMLEGTSDILEEKGAEAEQFTEESPVFVEEAASHSEEEISTVPKRDDLMTIQIKADTPEFESSGGNVYVLKKGDVLSIDRSTAELLIKMKKAERVEPRW